ncbi:MAG: carbamoyl-phosphate synthase large subunit [Leptospirales bacterium]|nr:carbamoyl-phosphate synthase large subunit [Leptospirales bacterium]
MPRRTDIKSILIPGSGPIVIGQACEFDYSGTQACKALRREGFRTILFNSNPATIMTDPEMADATYIEPLTPETLIRVIEKEKPDAILPTVGGQTALNLVMDLEKMGYLEKSGVKLIGANVAAIRKAESREEFKEAMLRIGMRVPQSALCSSMEEALQFKGRRGLPLIIRPSFTLGGAGGGIAFTDDDFDTIVQNGLNLSPTNQILLEESVLGWKEFELEVMRDLADNVVIICSIENIDPMGVHTGDSITVAPQQTLSDRQYQEMRDAAIKIIREIGVDTGGSNIQFGVNPKNGEMVVIEMNPRVSRSSALASKATGFPIAKIAALLAVGYTLDEVQNDITRVTPASFEPTIDYVVVKAPRFTFEKFPGASDTLGSMMKSVGEAMSIGRTFKESFQKAFRSLETGRYGFGADGSLSEMLRLLDFELQGEREEIEYLEASLARPTPERIYSVRRALELGLEKPESGFDVARVYELSGIDPWFLNQILDLLRLEMEYAAAGAPLDREWLEALKRNGYSDRQIGFLRNRSALRGVLGNAAYPEHERRSRSLELLSSGEAAVASARSALALAPVYKSVDTCAGEFEAITPYLYSTYEDEDESRVRSVKKVVILGGGPNRIGQGIEFDYCCCHASFALQKMGVQSIMVNSNPETVSTDYDTSDKLYFEPLSFEDVLNICRKEQPHGVILSFGGQTPLKLARRLEAAGIPILGTSPDAIDRAEDRDRFSAMLEKLRLRQPENGMASTTQEAEEVVRRIGYPCLVRPSYVLGGRAMAIVYEREQLLSFVREAQEAAPEHPVLIDRFLEDAIEIDVDALSDGHDVFVAGIMQHIEEAGVHSGDSACVLPPVGLPAAIIEEIRSATRSIALELNVVGLLNIQFAVQREQLYVIEVNPRASRTAPFVSKAIGLPLPALATRVMLGESLAQLKLPEDGADTGFVAVKEAVLPFMRFPGADIILGPEMKSTGEVMGIARDLGAAYLKAQSGAGDRIPQSGGIFFSVSDRVKAQLVEEAIQLQKLGYQLYGTRGTADFLRGHGVEMTALHKMRENLSPNALDLIKRGEIQLIINIPDSRRTRDDAFAIRQQAIRRRLLCITTTAAVRALVHGLRSTRGIEMEVNSLQSIHALRDGAVAPIA